ncbi:MAG TPA: hypothetical protein VFN67_03780 [Polyangiales bacterium]|nr:hypothetical protein [Polyangiales bacterium]
MQDRKPPSHMRRAKWAKRAQLVLGLMTAGFMLYHIVSGLFEH